MFIMEKKLERCYVCNKFCAESHLVNWQPGKPVCEPCWEKMSETAVGGKTKIQDSGERQTFKTGAVRDISEGKGRCDYLPLMTVKHILDEYGKWSRLEIKQGKPLSVLELVQGYLVTSETWYLTWAFCCFVDEAFDKDIHGAIIELSKHYEDGAKKYEPHNWKRGIPMHCYIDSAVRHYMKHLRGDKDEPHNRAVIWNLVGAIWTTNNRSDLDDLHGWGDIYTDSITGGKKEGVTLDPGVGLTWDPNNVVTAPLNDSILTALKTVPKDAVVLTSESKECGCKGECRIGDGGIIVQVVGGVDNDGDIVNVISEVLAKVSRGNE